MTGNIDTREYVLGIILEHVMREDCPIGQIRSENEKIITTTIIITILTEFQNS